MNQAIMNPITFCMDKGVSYYEQSLESDVFSNIMRLIILSLRR